MNQEKNPTSPFSALSYQEQQDRWLEWRSRQLNYREVNETPADAPAAQPSFSAPAAASRHQELDHVLARHAKALRNAGPFQPTSPAGSAQ